MYVCVVCVVKFPMNGHPDHRTVKTDNQTRDEKRRVYLELLVELSQLRQHSREFRGVPCIGQRGRSALCWGGGGGGGGGGGWGGLKYN